MAASSILPVETVDSETMSARVEPIRVLMVEDVTMDKAILLEMLRHDEQTTFDCEHVSTVTAACHQLEGNTFDCLLVDMNLPDSNGLHTVRRIQAASSAAFVVLTEFDDRATAEAAVALGAHDFLTKGRFNGRRLASAIRTAVAGHRAGFGSQLLDLALCDTSRLVATASS